MIPLQGRVAGKVALVTGAASGIGRASAMALAEQGASVMCSDLDPKGARQTAAAILAAGQTASFCKLDVTSEASWRATMEQVEEAFGWLDVLVSSAGISFGKPVAETTLKEWRRVMAVNLEGVFLGTRYAVAAMRRRSGGSIVHISSASGLKASPGASAYCASKAAVCMFSRAAARECLRDRLPIRVNTVCPGAVKTPIWRTVPFFQQLIEQHGSEEAAFQALAGPGGRLGEPEEIAQAILYLASDEARLVTGTDLVIDDGYTAGV